MIVFYSGYGCRHSDPEVCRHPFPWGKGRVRRYTSLMLTAFDTVAKGGKVERRFRTLAAKRRGAA